MDILSICADFLRKNVMFVAVAMITTTLAIYGIYIKKMVKNMTKNLNFLRNDMFLSKKMIFYLSVYQWSKKYFHFF